MLVIDPYIFFPNPTGGKYDAATVALLKLNLKKIIGTCRRLGLNIFFDRAGWKYLELNFIKKLTMQFPDPELEIALTILRKDYLQTADFDLVGSARTWGIKILFNGLTDDLNMYLADSVTRSFLHCLHSNKKVHYFVRELEGRNIKTWAVAHSFILERTRWRVYVSHAGLKGACEVPCVTSERNILVGWTSRYDIGLPNAGKFAFSPHTDWHLKKIKAVGVMKSKPVYFDIKGNGWARPNTPGNPHHWDVYIKDPVWKSACGVDQINVSRFGVPSNQGNQGEIHHIPTGKAGIVKK